MEYIGEATEIIVIKVEDNETARTLICACTQTYKENRFVLIGTNLAKFWELYMFACTCLIN